MGAAQCGASQEEGRAGRAENIRTAFFFIARLQGSATATISFFSFETEIFRKQK
jgi:hypothetical protein